MGVEIPVERGAVCTLIYPERCFFNGTYFLLLINRSRMESSC